MSERDGECSEPGCCGPSRREVLTAVGAGLAAVGMPVMAGPFEAKEVDPEHPVPLDKKLRPEWVASLTAKGEAERYSGKDLRFIGMPVGGIFAGTLYLGGDGRLWIWNIFNHDVNGVVPKTIEYNGQTVKSQDGSAYVQPAEWFSEVEQGFGVEIRSPKPETRRLDRDGFKEVTFLGQYPIGTVTYRDAACPVSVRLEAFSPFVPLDADDSGLPATMMQFAVKNDSAEAVEVTLTGWLQNAVLNRGEAEGARRVNAVREGKGMTFLECLAVEGARVEAERADVVFEDWTKKTYEGWTVEGTAFGAGPVSKKEMPAYQGDVGGDGDRVVNSHNARAAKSVAEGDAHVGRLISRPFAIERKFISFFVGGGGHVGKTCVNLVVEGKVVQSVSGKNDNRMSWATFDVRQLAGKTATIEIVDAEKGPWGNIGVGTIRFTDRRGDAVAVRDRADFGTMGLALIGGGAEVAQARRGEAAGEASGGLAEKLVGALGRTLRLGAGEEGTVTFLIAWLFPNLSVSTFKNVGRYYATRFDSARAVAQYVADHLPRLAGQTRLWRDTWYDSSLPYWFLNRTFANASTLATTTCYRFKDGRFWGWEGVGCCPGTCTHVWHYAQAMGRLFPQVERDQRERVDFGVGFNEKTGVIAHRAENGRGPAVDGQAGTILRTYREHQTSSDSTFLKRVWPKVKRAVEHLIEHDANGDGILEGAQENTLDAAWFGKIPWISGLYHAALRAAEEMAKEVGDGVFAARCRTIFDAGVKNLDEATWREAFGYYVQVPDPKRLDAIAAFDGCEIDQVLGQSWAWQVGLGRVMDAGHVRRALRSLWDYNFTPDVGPLRASLPPKVRGRPYAVAGDAGLLMCTWPKGGKRKDWQSHWQYMYFNECMSGFEWQAAGHLIWEGMVTEGLAVARAIHDRYSAKMRNPYNEVECSDHYARAMASCGAFLAACGFEYHGPKREMAFAPRIGQEDFRAAFTAAEGWGTYWQKFEGEGMVAELIVKSGRVRLMQFGVEKEGATEGAAEIEGRELKAKVEVGGRRVTFGFEREIEVKTGERLRLVVR